MVCCPFDADMMQMFVNACSLIVSCELYESLAGDARAKNDERLPDKSRSYRRSDYQCGEANLKYKSSCPVRIQGRARDDTHVTYM
jgi:hypothetical protein